MCWGGSCKTTEIILAAVILVFALWKTAFSNVMIIIAAVILLIHAFTCAGSEVCAPKAKAVSKARKKTRKR